MSTLHQVLILGGMANYIHATKNLMLNIHANRPEHDLNDSEWADHYDNAVGSFTKATEAAHVGDSTGTVLHIHDLAHHFKKLVASASRQFPDEQKGIEALHRYSTEINSGAAQLQNSELGRNLENL